VTDERPAAANDVGNVAFDAADRLPTINLLGENAIEATRHCYVRVFAILAGGKAEGRMEAEPWTIRVDRGNTGIPDQRAVAHDNRGT
jgi:hypothetical protein